MTPAKTSGRPRLASSLLHWQRMEILADLAHAGVPEVSEKWGISRRLAHSVQQSDPTRVLNPAEHQRALERARNEFIRGTGCATGEEAVALGKRTLEAWADMLMNLTTYADPKPKTKPRRAAGARHAV